jgi:hypothetical protein
MGNLVLWIERDRVGPEEVLQVKPQQKYGVRMDRLSVEKQLCRLREEPLALPRLRAAQIEPSCAQIRSGPMKPAISTSF